MTDPGAPEPRHAMNRAYAVLRQTGSPVKNELLPRCGDNCGIAGRATIREFLIVPVGIGHAREQAARRGQR